MHTQPDNPDTPVIIKVGKITVEISYSDTDTTFTDCFERYMNNV